MPPLAAGGNRREFRSVYPRRADVFSPTASRKAIRPTTGPHATNFLSAISCSAHALVAKITLEFHQEQHVVDS
jgi:hypothetical protein